MTLQITSDLIDKLQTIMSSDAGSLRASVAKEALDYDDPVSFFRDLLAHGCISGMVSSLIYYSDTHDFFDHHYDAIEILRTEYEEQCGQPLTFDGDLKNALAWFAFEQTAYRLACELGIEI